MDRAVNAGGDGGFGAGLVLTFPLNSTAFWSGENGAQRVPFAFDLFATGFINSAICAVANPTNPSRL